MLKKLGVLLTSALLCIALFGCKGEEQKTDAQTPAATTQPAKDKATDTTKTDAPAGETKTPEN